MASGDGEPQYAAERIRINAIAPGIVDTPMHKPENHESLKRLHPIPRLAMVQEIVDAALFWCGLPSLRERCSTLTAAHTQGNGRPLVRCFPTQQETAGVSLRAGWIESPQVGVMLNHWRFSSLAHCASSQLSSLEGGSVTRTKRPGCFTILLLMVHVGSQLRSCCRENYLGRL